VKAGVLLLPRSANQGRARRSWRLLAHALASAVTVGVAACSSSVGLQKDGTYGLDGAEKAMDCQRIANSIWGRLQVLQALPERAKAEKAAAAPTAALAFGRLFGANKGLVALSDYDRERAHARSLHKASTDKGCPPIDVERELAATDAAIAEYRK
jgi:hypothetical protein